jgi:hypothetical protein
VSDSWVEAEDVDYSRTTTSEVKKSTGYEGVLIG